MKPTTMDVFNEYMIHHTPELNVIGSAMFFCSCGAFCADCKARKICDERDINSGPYFDEKTIIKIKLEYPEFFV